MFRLRSGHLSHEDWFKVEKDAFAGSIVQPGENDGRNDAFQNVISGAKRFFNQNRNEDAADLATSGEAASNQTVKDEATVPRMVSPVFHQFLDCTYQLLRQNPTRFEYNERFLRRLLYHLHSCQYGTFLYNSEKQRRDAKVAERTSSVWDYFLCRKAEFTNPEYDPTIDDHVKGRERIIFPRLKEIRWWYQLFGRTDDEMNGALNAAALAEVDRQAAVSGLQYPSVMAAESSPRSSGSAARPPSLPTSQSVLTAVENAHQTLTPEQAHQPALRRSASAEGGGTFTAIRDGLAGLNIGRGVLGNVGRKSESSAAEAPPPRDQELRDMT
jgi:myotubularin-related protein 6/7/8